MDIKNLPKRIAVFPLSNAVFFPKTILPLNIFEERYIQLISDCMKNQRLFGMVQSKKQGEQTPEVYKVGCLGKIISFNETNDKRFIINLSGVIRFRIKEELSNIKLYREFNVDYSDFEQDLKIIKKTHEYDRKKILKKINLFFKKKNYLVNLSELEKLKFDQLISTICMITPLSVAEKQKLIETITLDEKIQILENIINFNLADNMQSKTIQ